MMNDPKTKPARIATPNMSAFMIEFVAPSFDACARDVSFAGDSGAGAAPTSEVGAPTTLSAGGGGGGGGAGGGAGGGGGGGGEAAPIVDSETQPSTPSSKSIFQNQ